MTVHWIENDQTLELKRRMAVLLLKRMTKEITFKEIGTAINEVLQMYDIREKVILCTTDNGSNFLKAFR